MKTPTAKIAGLRDKLLAMSQRGVNGEAEAAKAKLARLEARYDFTKPILRTGDLFAGRFSASETARLICEVPDLNLATYAKWAIEQATHIQCSFRSGSMLFAEASPKTCQRLETITRTIVDGCTVLWDKFKGMPVAKPEDRTVFLRGIYDGMMDEQKQESEKLPTFASKHTRSKAKKRDIGRVAGLAVHPYQIGVGLGREIRFSVPLEDVTNQLEQTVTKAIEDHDRRPKTK